MRTGGGLKCSRVQEVRQAAGEVGSKRTGEDGEKRS